MCEYLEIDEIGSLSMFDRLIGWDQGSHCMWLLVKWKCIVYYCGGELGVTESIWMGYRKLPYLIERIQHLDEMHAMILIVEYCITITIMRAKPNHRWQIELSLQIDWMLILIAINLIGIRAFHSKHSIENSMPIFKFKKKTITDIFSKWLRSVVWKIQTHRNEVQPTDFSALDRNLRNWHS